MRKRRGRGEGSIYQRGDGTWCATVSAGYAASGKRRRKTVYGPTKAAVQRKLGRAAADVARGLPVETQKLTVKEYLERWLDTAVKPSVAPTTHDRYKTVVEQQLVPHLGGMRLAKVEPVHVEHLYSQLDAAGASPRARQLAGVVLGKALRHAVVLKLIGSNPTREIAKARVPKREMTVWDASQVGLFLKGTAADRMHALYVVALATGMRQGELFALEWGDVNFDAGVVTVQRSLEEIRGKVRPKETKTGRGRRIDLPAFALKALQVHRATMLAEGHIACPVFCALEGGHLRKGNVYNRSFVPLVKAAKVPMIRFHDLRHTHATLLLAAGENVKVVSERLGHASIKITLDTYAHVLPTMQQAAAVKLQKLLG